MEKNSRVYLRSILASWPPDGAASSDPIFGAYILFPKTRTAGRDGEALCRSSEKDRAKTLGNRGHTGTHMYNYFFLAKDGRKLASYAWIIECIEENIKL